MSMLDEPNETLMSIARDMVGGRQRASMKVIYARRPYKDANSGKPIAMAGWITWIDDDTLTGALWQKVALGWQPLKQFGYLGSAQGAPDERGPWQKILEHKDGPAQFPTDQLIEFGWYDPERVPVQGVRFPQLRGMKIPLYPCPECSDRDFVKPIHLARHCRNAHSYDRKDIQDLATQLGIDLVREMYGAREKLRVYDYSEPDAEVDEPEIPSEYEIERAPILPRGDGRDRQPVAKKEPIPA
ncbi:MAG TPA: hypothetical protein VNG04_11120 [Candidatus Acidoferrum sp.]|nr:hypothetical protein [Candidatus Acidoferrum sp.]